MSALDDLKTRRDNICAELAALTATSAGGKPNAGQSGVDHVGYKDGLYRELREINAQIAAIAAQTEGPWEEYQEAFSG